MTVDLGDTARLAFDLRDPAGDWYNAGTVTLTITLPDGTSEEPTVTNPPAQTGRLRHDYVTTQAGRHTVRWTAVGPGALSAAYTDVLDVRTGAARGLISLADAKRHLKLDPADNTHDEDLRGFIDSVTDVIEGITGPIVQDTITEVHSGDGGHAIALLCCPVIAVIEVIESGVTLDPADYSLSPLAGCLYRVAGYTDLAWARGRHNIDIHYLVGRRIVRPSLIEAARELTRVNFRPQLGGNYSAFDQGASDDFGTSSNLGPQGQYRLGFFVPNRVMQLLERWAQGPGGI